MTVCTGNICRSPLAEQLIRLQVEPLGGRVTSAGTMGLDAAPMPTDALRLAAEVGVPADMSAAHRSRFMTEQILQSPSLVLGMSREHRKRIVELAPAKMRTAFTLREFARLAEHVSDDEIRAAADAAFGTDAAARVKAAAQAVAGMRGAVPPPADPADDDIIDPYRRSWNTYQLSGSQLVPAIDQVGRVVTLALA